MCVKLSALFAGLTPEKISSVNGRPSTGRPAVCTLPAFAVLLALLLLPLFSSCGYHVTSGEGLGRIDGAARTIKMAIGSVDDRSRDPLLGALVRQGLARRGVERSDVVIVDNPSEEELSGVYVLSAQLGTLWEEARASTVAAGSREYLLRGSGDATVKSAGETVWLGRNITARREFATGSDVDSIVFNKDRALKLLADDLAGEIMRRALLGIRRRGK